MCLNGYSAFKSAAEVGLAVCSQTRDLKMKQLQSKCRVSVKQGKWDRYCRGRDVVATVGMTFGKFGRKYFEEMYQECREMFDHDVDNGGMLELSSRV